MNAVTRREFLHASAVMAWGAAAVTVCGMPSPATAVDEADKPTQEWMEAWMKPRLPEGTLHLSRFVEAIYFLTKSIAWKPSPGQALSSVSVPVGFVTDFASIPRVFWTLLPPDGEYTYPAILHDYLYWRQATSRGDADLIFKLAMGEFGIKPAVVETIYAAVRLGGGTAWDGNAKLKQAGEKRVLKRFPDDPRVRWSEWKTRPDVFADE
jgi:hypothetical protein